MTANRDLRAEFLTDEKLRLYRGARCKLPTGKVVEATNRRTPFYDLARELAYMGCRRSPSSQLQTLRCRRMGAADCVKSGPRCSNSYRGFDMLGSVLVCR
jgi:hypothetical protein